MGEGKASVNQADNDGWAPLHIATQEVHIRIVVYLIRVGKANVDQANTKGETSLHIAARRSHIVMVRCLVEEGKASVHTASAKGATPLLASLRAKKVNIAVPSFLLSMGARVRKRNLDDPVFNSFVKGGIHNEVQKLEVRSHMYASLSYLSVSIPILFTLNAYAALSMQEAATLRAMHEQLPVVPTDIAKIVAAYMMSRSWNETRARITL
jgi:hypothetical protein